MGLFLRLGFEEAAAAAAPRAAAAALQQLLQRVLPFHIKQKQKGKGYNLTIQQALCIAQTDPEPEAREQALAAVDS